MKSGLQHSLERRSAISRHVFAKRHVSIRAPCRGRAFGAVAPPPGTRWIRESSYQAGSWSRPRRVVQVVAERPGELIPQCFWLLTSMASGEISGEDLLELYRKRGKAEGHLGELASVVSPALSSIEFGDYGVPPPPARGPAGPPHPSRFFRYEGRRRRPSVDPGVPVADHPAGAGAAEGDGVGGTEPGELGGLPTSGMNMYRYYVHNSGA